MNDAVVVDNVRDPGDVGAILPVVTMVNPYPYVGSF
jgi:hypothetical protein